MFILELYHRFILVFLSMQFEGAFGMLKDLEKMNLTPTASMYNAIIAGYFREVVFLT